MPRTNGKIGTGAGAAAPHAPETDINPQQERERQAQVWSGRLFGFQGVILSIDGFASLLAAFGKDAFLKSLGDYPSTLIKTLS